MRFYAELRDFLPDEDHSAAIIREFDVSGSLKDLIESCGVPHTEVDLIIVEGESVGFDYPVHDGDHISVYPVFESFDISPIIKVRGEPLRETRFVADVHLGRLARYLRLLGFDTLHDKDWGDADLAEISSKERRILLTRDVELLKRSTVTHGYYLRSDDPRTQVVEVTRRFHLDDDLKPFTRCMICNGPVSPVDKADVAHRVPSRTRERVDDYARCGKCGRVYWQGAHRSGLERVINASRARGGGLR
ncbi:MAG TPA: Mut7-C RNAse domain-containing protein [Acidimicrobiia bacterium]